MICILTLILVTMTLKRKFERIKKNPLKYHNYKLNVKLEKCCPKCEI